MIITSFFCGDADDDATALLTYLEFLQSFLTRHILPTGHCIQAALIFGFPFGHCFPSGSTPGMGGDIDTETCAW